MSRSRRKRNRIQIIQDILNVIAEPNGASRTEIVYGAYLNFGRLDDYLKPLLNKGIIEERNTSTTVYFLTFKGRSFLDQIKEIVEFL
jgi:predicted transcriptional regulator